MLILYSALKPKLLEKDNIGPTVPQLKNSVRFTEKISYQSDSSESTAETCTIVLEKSNPPSSQSPFSNDYNGALLSDSVLLGYGDANSCSDSDSKNTERYIQTCDQCILYSLF